MRRLEGRLALVTGASRGIGAAAAKAFAAEGAHVVLVARTVGGLEEVDDAIQAAGGSGTLVPLDLADGDAIDRLGASLYERWGRLDILLGNAAMLGPLSPVGHLPPDYWERVFRLNVTANFRLIRALDPLLRLSPAGRAIFMTSGAARSTPAYWGLYSASKLALEGLALTYAREVAATSVRVNLVNPGRTLTAMRREAFPGEDRDSLPPPEHICGTLVRLATAEFQETGLRFGPDGNPSA